MASSKWRAVFSNVVKNIGSHGSKPEKRLSDCLPPSDRPITDKDGQLKRYTGWHVFASEYVRNHFIKAVLILLSENGTHDLSNLSFDNFFSRAYDEEGNIYYTASIVAMDEFKIRHTLLSPNAATTKSAAFQLLMLEIEGRMSNLLRDSSNASTAVLPTVPITESRLSTLQQRDSSSAGTGPPTLPMIATQKSESLQLEEVESVEVRDKEEEHAAPLTVITDAPSIYSIQTAEAKDVVSPLNLNWAANLSVHRHMRRSLTLRY